MAPLDVFGDGCIAAFRGHCNRLQWPNALGKCQSMPLTDERGNTAGFKSKWGKRQSADDQVCDELFIVGIMFCGEQAAVWNESYLIQHHLRMKKNLCARNHPVRESMNRSFRASSGFWLSLSQIHTKSIASEMQELCATGFLHFYIRKI